MVAGFFFSLSTTAQAPYCVLPTALTSATLTYTKLPGPNNIRFFYKVFVECGGSRGLGFEDLHVLDPTSGTPAGKIYAWELDSTHNVTEVLDPCVTLSTPPCFTVYYYHTDIHTPDITKSSSVITTYCCRPYDAVNILYRPVLVGYSNPPPDPELKCPQVSGGPVGNGMSSFIKMPALMPFPNSSPQFTGKDSILTMCINRPLSYYINATDPDNDSLVYHFNTPRTYYNDEDNRGVITINYHKSPQLPFKPGFTEQQPAGPDLQLNPVTGLLDGTITAAGVYDITVSVLEYRDGVFLDSVTEDIFIKAYDCGTLTKPVASIPDSINSCTDFTILFPNYSQPIYQNVTWNNTTFQWDFGDGGISNEVNPVHTYADTGTYQSRLIIFPGLYCSDTTYSKVIVYPFVQADFNYTDSCSSTDIQFLNNSTSSSGAITSSYWTVSEKNEQIYSSDKYNASFSFTKAPETYFVHLKVTNEKGCQASDSVYLNIYQSPHPLASHDTILSRGASLQLMVNDGNANFNGEYLWTPASGLSDPFIANPVLNSTIDNTYFVQVKNKFGCLMNDSIIVKYYTGPDIYVPNAFTPNNDGVNDIFRPVNVGISTLNYFNVYNRYGQLVFQTHQPHQGWDGYTYGRPAPTGTYIWEVKGLDYTGKSILKKGTVELLR